MCCFSGRVESVRGTQIFARLGSDNRQFLVYEMLYQTNAPVAMVLPLPVAPNGGEQAVRFYNLQGYTKLFADLYSLFYYSEEEHPAIRRWQERAKARVEQVGDFVASYVPTQTDFVRLDPRFRLPKSALRTLTQYAEWGYAVFQLRQTPRRAVRVHPMALSFPVREGGKLFFPTVHIHDGQVHEKSTSTMSIRAVGRQYRRHLTTHLLAFAMDEIETKHGGNLGHREIAGIIEARLPVHRRNCAANSRTATSGFPPADLT
jgi:hypothetical protein